MDPNEKKWLLQNYGESVVFYVYDSFLDSSFLPIILIAFCFALSSIMSGLNIGLMALDLNELHLLKTAGTEKEKKYANKIIPLRKDGNYLLCSILITCTLCNSVATVCIDNLVSGKVAVLITTIVIVLCCEILPQAICTSYPLPIGAKTAYITRVSMWISFPVSYPLSKILNYTLGKELRATYTKERLRELLKMTKLPVSEEKIISGALDLSQKKVEDVMTVLDDIFTLPLTAVMDFDTIKLICGSGFSRIPIYDKTESDIRYVLLTKDLVMLDPNDHLPLKALVQNSKYVCHYMSTDTTLDNALSLFLENRWHMAFVVDRKELEDENDNSVVGLITFEDVIEEIFQAEIIDETDTFTDNRNKHKVSTANETISIISALKKNINKAVSPSENMKLTIFDFLSGLDIFSQQNISSRVLSRILNLDVFFVCQGKNLAQDNIYVRGAPVDFFVMILEGQMEVKFGSEELKFEAGPFKYYGRECLKAELSKSGYVYTPDFTLQAENQCLYLKITKVIYAAALLATKYEQFSVVPDADTPSEVMNCFRALVG